MRYPFRLQVFWPHAALLILALSGVSLLNAYLATRHLERESIAHLRGIVDGLAGSNFPLTESVLARMKNLSGVEFILSDEQGRIRATSTAWPRADIERLATSFGESRPPRSIMLGGTAFRHSAIAARTETTGQPPNVLHVLFPESRWRENRQRAMFPSLVVGAAAILVVAALSWVIAARVSVPIQGLRTQLSRLAAGDFQIMNVPPRDDEILDLVLSANTTAKGLEKLLLEVQTAERRSALGLLSAGLAHQVRNSATGARMALQIHEKECPAPNREALDVAARQLIHIEDYVGRFLDAGKSAEAVMTTVRPRNFWREVEALVAPAFRHRGVALRANPADWDDETMWADPNLLRQMLVNLLLNALEAAGTGGWVQVEWSKTDAQLRINILDSGSGIEPADADRLFEPFFTRRAEGVGMGLAVAQRIAAAHGGEITYAPRNGTTCFTCELPLGLATY